jgi:hypothetical protein
MIDIRRAGAGPECSGSCGSGARLLRVIALLCTFLMTIDRLDGVIEVHDIRLREQRVPHRPFLPPEPPVPFLFWAAQ